MRKFALTSRSMAVGLLAVLTLTACGAQTASGPAPTVTVTAPASEAAVTNSPSPSASTKAPSASPTGPEVISVDPGAERVLTKSDAFSADNWDEGSYQPVGQAQEIQALAANAYCDRGSKKLEFRFAQNAGSLTFQVAKAMSSRSSGEILEWALVVDGRQVMTKKIAFKESVELTTPLAGVAVVQLQVSNPRPCSGEATGLVTRAVIKG